MFLDKKLETLFSSFSWIRPTCFVPGTDERSAGDSVLGNAVLVTWKYMRCAPERTRIRSSRLLCSSLIRVIAALGRKRPMATFKGEMAIDGLPKEDGRWSVHICIGQPPTRTRTYSNIIGDPHRVQRCMSVTHTPLLFRRKPRHILIMSSDFIS